MDSFQSLHVDAAAAPPVVALTPHLGTDNSSLALQQAMNETVHITQDGFYAFLRDEAK